MNWDWVAKQVNKGRDVSSFAVAFECPNCSEILYRDTPRPDSVLQVNCEECGNESDMFWDGQEMIELD